MIDMATLERWMHAVGFDLVPDGPPREEPKDPVSTRAPVSPTTLRIVPRDDKHPDLPPFFLQRGENWILLSILPVLPPDADLPADLHRRLLSVNRDMRIAKFALGTEGSVVLCAELPTESLDRSELVDAVERMVKYFGHYREYLLKP